MIPTAEELGAIWDRHAARKACYAKHHVDEDVDTGACEHEEGMHNDIGVLIAEVDRLRALVTALNPCPTCHTYNLVRRLPLVGTVKGGLAL
jgi:hypothetical protein